ncbi:MAG: hypothetical protein M9896_19240 [Candidatus Promineofilum sp.]|uniref:hypothetical protein n=1 Tax=Promineifilum sp. TaxID=2664178 RepID=UPI002411C6D3|nr:hypothetical protein [Promineifilum sp.]
MLPFLIGQTQTFFPLNVDSQCPVVIEKRNCVCESQLVEFVIPDRKINQVGNAQRGVVAVRRKQNVPIFNRVPTSGMTEKWNEFPSMTKPNISPGSTVFPTVGMISTVKAPPVNASNPAAAPSYPPPASENAAFAASTDVLILAAKASMRGGGCQTIHLP